MLYILQGKLWRDTYFSGTYLMWTHRVCSGVTKPRHTRARAQATFACALAFACCSFKLVPHAKESTCDRKKRLNSNKSTSWMLEMCIIFATLTWPENLADVISEVLNSTIFQGGMPPEPSKRVCFRTLTFRTLCSTVYVALPAPEQLPYSGYATVCLYFGGYWYISSRCGTGYSHLYC